MRARRSPDPFERWLAAAVLLVSSCRSKPDKVVADEQAVSVTSAPRPTPPKLSLIGVYHHDGMNLELRADGRFRLSERGCVMVVMDVDGGWTQRADRPSLMLTTDGRKPMEWGMFATVDELEVERADDTITSG